MIAQVPSAGKDQNLSYECRSACPPGFPGTLVVKKPPANAGDMGDAGSIPGLGRSPGGGRGYPLQYSCLENPIDKGA